MRRPDDGANPPVPSLPPNATMRWSIVKRHVNALQPATILEIGCGQGAFGARLATAGTFLGLEPDPTSFAIAASRIEPAGGTVRNEGYAAIEPGRTFDLVCAFEVLEHLEDDVGALRDWLQLVTPGRHLMLSMPAFQDRFNAWDAMVGHYRRYSPDSARAVVTAAGFIDIDVTLYGWPLGYWTEAVRGRVAQRRGVATEDTAPPVMDERTAASGRHFQPKRIAGAAVHAATMPFVPLQRLRPTRGTGVVVLARRP